MSIRRRFFLYMLAFLVLILLGGVAALSLPRGLRSANSTVILLGKEKDHLAQNVKTKFGDTSAQVVSLSRELSASLERKLEELHISMSDLDGNQKLLTEVLNGEINRLLFSLEKTKCSGVFIALNSTVNPGVESAETSRAGVYIRNIDRGFMDKNADQLYLRGPSQIAIAEDFTLQSRWALEFDVQNQQFWEGPSAAHEENPTLPLSRLYYWYVTDSFPGLNENAVVCSAPLLDGDGRFLGVCGFETGARRFARDNALDIDGNSNFAGLLFAFSVPNGKRFYPGEALFTGNGTLSRELSKQKKLTAGENFHGLKVLKDENGGACVGLWSDVPLYPSGSPFVDENFTAAVVIPKKDFDGIVFASRLRIALIAAILLCAGITLSVLFSDRYERPFKELLEALRSGDMEVKSHIQEIDDLLEFMRSQLDEIRLAENDAQNAGDSDEGKMSENSANDLLDSFIENTKKLSRAEADVFNLYLEGHTAQEIASILTLSINTIKTHNRRIFAKLNVSSRKELLTWVQVLSASGRSLDEAHQKQFDKIRNIVNTARDTPSSSV